MFSKVTTFLVLAAITLQGVLGSLQDSVIICLGGGHEHDAAEVVEECHLGCTHDSEWPTPSTNDDHLEDCDCTDIELALIVLLTTPRTSDHDLQAAPPPPVEIATIRHAPIFISLRGPPPELEDDPGNAQRLAVLRSTRLLI